MRNPKWLAVIAWSEIIGGAAGFFLLPVTYSQYDRLQIPEALRMGPGWYVAAAVAFLCSIVAGLLLRRGKMLGRTMSAVLQAFQIIQFSTGILVYQFVTGLELLVFLSPTEVRLSPGVRAAFTAMPPKVQAPWSVAVNLFAVLALFVILRSGRATTDEPAIAHSAV
jgi:hypothetical protein